MTKNTTYLSLSQAAEETGKSKSVISKALKSGRLSHTGKEDGAYQIDPAELFRVFPKNTQNVTKNTSKERPRTAENNLENAFKIRELEIKLEAEGKEKIFYKDQYSKMEIEKDDWKNQAQKLLLAAPEKPVQAANGNLVNGVRYSTKKALQGQNLTGYGAIVLVIVALGFMSWVYWPDIENRMNGSGVTNIAPAVSSTALESPLSSPKQQSSPAMPEITE